LLAALRLGARTTFLRRLAGVGALRDLLEGERFGARFETLEAFFPFLILFFFGIAFSAEVRCVLLPKRNQNPSWLASLLRELTPTL
jgi:hypothetical protein